MTPAPRPPQTPGPLSYAKVALNRPLAQVYTYYIPQSFDTRIQIGSLVQAPLRNDVAEGVVVDIMDASDVKATIKPLTRHLSPDYRIEPAMIELGRWVADYYFCSLGEALATISMIGLNDVAAKTRTCLTLAHPHHWLTQSRDLGPDGVKSTLGHKQVIMTLLGEGTRPLPPEELKEMAGVGDGVLDTMLKRGWLAKVQEELAREDEYNTNEEPTHSRHVRLTPAQQEAYDEINGALHGGEYKTFLLHGVTGSGKTEIYLQVIEEALRIGRSAVVLVPEIALTPQIVEAFRRRLGEVVGIYHSKQTMGQKFDLWRRIAEREVRVVIGARSALFSPLPDLGVIIVDEEHESSYKQGETPRYHARDVAVVRGARQKALVVLGSATPSVESLNNAREGKYTLLRLPERVGPHASPTMVVVDMKRNLKDGQFSLSTQHLISPPLQEAIEKRLAAGEQSLLLLNRRGFANQVICLKCEQAVMCPHCDVPMTYHKTVDRLLCHWCGARQPVPRVCPECSSGDIHTLGLGTQRIEEVLAGMFPKARTLRVDMDSMRRRGAYQEAWRKITGHEVDIIFGTQMIAKGLHVESVTLVGVISADFALYLPDFRSAERTYSLLTQVAGRAGRGEKPGEVIVQTFIPHHYAIDCAARLAETEFYEQELHTRRMLRFPPFARLAGLILSGTDPDLTRDQAERLANILKALAYRSDYKAVNILGATPAPLAKLEDRHRWRILARGAKASTLHALLREGLAQFERVHKRSHVDLTIDIDALDFM